MRIGSSLKLVFVILAIAAAVVLLAASPAFAYVIILKNGSRIVVRQRPVLRGDSLVFQDKIGTYKMIPASEVDQPATDKANEIAAQKAPESKDPEIVAGPGLPTLSTNGGRRSSSPAAGAYRWSKNVAAVPPAAGRQRVETALTNDGSRAWLSFLDAEYKLLGTNRWIASPRKVALFVTSDRGFT